MDTLFQDLRYGVRMLLKGRAITAIAILALTLGIGANTAIFSVVNAVLLKPLPYPQPDRLVRIYEKSSQDEMMPASYPNFLDWREQSQLFEDMSIFRYQGFNITGSQGPERVQGQFISSGFFPALGIQPVVGRSVLPEEDKPGGAPVIAISYALWQRRFGGDSNIPGEALAVNGKDYTIVGVLPAGFRFYSQADVFIPIGAQDNPSLQSRGVRPNLSVIGRLKPGVTIEQARAEMNGIALGLEQQYPESNKGFGVSLTSMRDDLVGNVKPTLFILLGAVAFVLLIACVNVANLLLSRAAARQKEVAIRMSLGAGRRRIIRQLLTESLLLAIAGGGLGLLLAKWGTDALIAAMPKALPRAEDIGIDMGVLIFTLLVSVLTGIIFGLAPALHSSKPDLNESLKEGARSLTTGRKSVRSILVVLEVALALVLLIGAGLMIKSVYRLRSVDSGLTPSNVLTMRTPLSLTTYNKPVKIRAFYQQLLERINGVPGVQSAGITADMPFTGAESVVGFWTGGGPRPAPDALQHALFCPTSAGYTEAMGIPILKGRFISEQDTQSSPPVAVIDENLARSLFPDEDPVGKRLTIQGFFRNPDILCEIIGVLGHVKHYGLEADSKQEVQYQLYFPYVQVPDLLLTRMVEGMTVVIRTHSDPEGLAPDVKNQVLAIDKDQPVNNVRTMEQIISTSISQQRFSMLLLGIFAGVALILTSMGIYGVMSYTVTQRTPEIGVRMALGARAADVLKIIMQHGMTLAVIGVVIGVGGAFALTRLMASLLFGVTASDPATFVIVTVLLTLVALVACYIPARRATKIDPMVALRYE